MMDDAKRPYRKLLFAEPPLVIDRTFARTVGLDKTVLLTLLQECILAEGVPDDKGTVWLRASAERIREIAPYWSTSTLRRMLHALIEEGYLQTAKNSNAWDKTKLFAMGGSAR